MKQNYYAAHAPVNPEKGFRIHFLVFLIVSPIAWMVWYLTDTTYLWPLWTTALWGVGIVFHYLGAYVFKKSRSAQNRELNK